MNSYVLVHYKEVCHRGTFIGRLLPILNPTKITRHIDHDRFDHIAIEYDQRDNPMLTVGGFMCVYLRDIDQIDYHLKDSTICMDP